MKKFLKTLTGFLLLPALVVGAIVGSYFYLDPFKVLYKYDSYFENGKLASVILNNDYVSVETFLRHYPEFHYDSYIFGNSRTRFYEMDQWKQYINSDRCFHFDASRESLYGIERKVEFLHERKVKIANAIIAFDYSTLVETRNSSGHLFIKHPLLSGENKLAFQADFLSTYCSPKFLMTFIQLKAKGRMPHLEENKLTDLVVGYNVKYNEPNCVDIEKIIQTTPDSFYTPSRMTEFQERPTTEQFSPPVIGPVQLDMLQKIRKILSSDSTNYKIIINPLYDQKRLATVDIIELQKIFGLENVFDFSGINSFTSDYRNYYEHSHYRPKVASDIMKIIYNK